MVRYILKWERDGWKTASGEPVKHQELIKNIRAILKKHEKTIQIRHISELGLKSHQPLNGDESNFVSFVHHGNEMADKLSIA